MSKITRVDPGKRMSQSVTHGGTVYLSGQVGDPASDLQGQTREVLAKIDALLEGAGSSKSHLLMATIWLSDMSYFAAMNEVWEGWIVPGAPPARCCGEAKLATPELLVEIMIVAAVAE